jgi:hypothetical protein
MEYAIPAALVLLVITAVIVLLVNRATAKGGPVAEGDDAPGIGTDERSPFGDTPEHAGTQDEQGRTVGRQDAGEHGGTGHSIGGPESTGAGRFARPEDESHIRREGEAEGVRRTP